jgi:hypothetical protein
MTRRWCLVVQLGGGLVLGAFLSASAQVEVGTRAVRHSFFFFPTETSTTDKGTNLSSGLSLDKRRIRVTEPGAEREVVQILTSHNIKTSSSYSVCTPYLEKKKRASWLELLRPALAGPPWSR